MAVCIAGTVGVMACISRTDEVSSSNPLCEYMAYGCAGRCTDMGRSPLPVEADAMLLERSMVCWGYMPYGWLGPVSKGFSDMLVVAKEAVELTESRWCSGDWATGG